MKRVHGVSWPAMMGARYLQKYKFVLRFRKDNGAAVILTVPDDEK